MMCETKRMVAEESEQTKLIRENLRKRLIIQEKLITNEAVIQKIAEIELRLAHHIPTRVTLSKKKKEISENIFSCAKPSVAIERLFQKILGFKA